MERVNHIYGSIRLIVKEYNDSFPKQLDELARHRNAVLVEIDHDVFHAAPQAATHLASFGFVFHYRRKSPEENVMIWKGGRGVQHVPDAMNAHLGVALILYDRSSDSVLLIVEKRSRINRDTQEVENLIVTKPVTGSVDLGEHPEQAALREMHEEVGIDSAQLALLNLYTMDTKSSLNSNKVMDTCIYFGAEVDKPLAIGKLASDEGITHAEWIPREQLPARGVSDMTVKLANMFKINYNLKLANMFH